MEEIKTAKAESWKYNEGVSKNYVTEGELTVTITLAEYRELVTDQAKCAEMRIASYNDGLKIQTLTQENETLKAELAAIRKAAGKC